MDIYMNLLTNKYDSDYKVTGFFVNLCGKDPDNDKNQINIKLELTSKDFPQAKDLSSLSPQEIRTVSIKKAISYLK